MTTLSSGPHHAGRGCHSTKLSLVDAVTKADETAVLFALESGADINAEDQAGRSVIGCAIAGERWEDADASDTSYKLQQRLNVLNDLLSRDSLSLYALNAPQNSMRGVTPLGLAAWLNVPDAVKILLEACPGLVSVDGMDALGATPLMYAARDGSVQVVQHLLASGARPDYRDVNHRTSIQHALAHPQVLWLCETALRRRRSRETTLGRNRRHVSELHPEPIGTTTSLPFLACHPRLALNPPSEELHRRTDVLISAILTGNVNELDSLLFPSSSLPSSSALPPPFLVNYPDPQGWSPIHHCVSADSPSIAVLDILYKAGADLSLYTRSGHGTPLHCLAHKAQPWTPPSIRAFIIHLVFDLTAPLAARDRENETCLHIAAEHGHSLEVLSAFLACDPTGTVRELRNSRGLTAFEVAKPEFRRVFGASLEPDRSASSASVRTIKPSTSSSESGSSMGNLGFWDSYVVRGGGRGLRDEQPSASGLDTENTAYRILENLSSISSQLSLNASAADIKAAEDTLRQTIEMSEDILVYLQAQVNEAEEDLRTARDKFSQVESLLEDTIGLVETKYGERFVAIEQLWDTDDRARRRTTDSAGTGSTLVEESDTASMILEKPLMVDVAVSTVPPPLLTTNTMDDGAVAMRTDPQPYQSSFDTTRSLRPVKSLTDIRQERSSAIRGAEDWGFLKLVPWVKDLPRKRSKGELDSKYPSTTKSPGGTVDKDLVKNGAARVRAWIKKKLAPLEFPEPLAVVRAIDEEGCTVGREVRQRTVPTENREESEAEVARREIPHAYRVVSTASKDLSKIRERVDSAERYVTLSARSISQASRLLRKAIEELKSSLHRAHLIQHIGEFDYTFSDSRHSLSRKSSIEFPPITIPTSSRDSQLIFPRPPLSSKPSLDSFSSAITDEDEDEDTRALRKLLTQKIQVRIDGASDEIDKISTWLRIVKDVVRGVRRRTRFEH